MTVSGTVFENRKKNKICDRSIASDFPKWTPVHDELSRTGNGFVKNVGERVFFRQQFTFDSTIEALGPHNPT